VPEEPSAEKPTDNPQETSQQTQQQPKASGGASGGLFDLIKMLKGSEGKSKTKVSTNDNDCTKNNLDLNGVSAYFPVVYTKKLIYTIIHNLFLRRKQHVNQRMACIPLS